MQRITIGQDTFEVPSERLLSTEVAFLPPSQNEALRFILNPEAPEAEQISVSVQDADVICHLLGAKSANYRGESCGGGKQFSRTPLRRVDVQNSGGTLWEYFNPEDIRVATCYALGNGEGNCTADGRYRSTIFSIQFSDNRIDDLSGLGNEVIATLARWHVPTAR